MQNPKLVIVRSCASRPEADLAKGALEDAGIPAMIQADTAGGMREHLAWSGAGFRTWCARKTQTSRATCSLHPAESSESSDADSKLTATFYHPGANLPRDPRHRRTKANTEVLATWQRLEAG